MQIHIIQTKYLTIKIIEINFQTEKTLLIIHLNTKIIGGKLNSTQTLKKKKNHAVYFIQRKFKPVKNYKNENRHI